MLPLLAAMHVAAECNAPERPELPDGARSTREEMLAGLKAVRAFQADNMAYMQCLERHFNRARGQAGISQDSHSRALADGEYSAAMDAYNAAVSEEEDVAGTFNIELREFRAMQR
ncbi:MAG: hypothetical protein AAF640_04155 [Pseudomonadota bacterium]